MEYDDLFDNNSAVDRKVAKLKDNAQHELTKLDVMAGAILAIDYMKARLVDSDADRLNRIESNTTTVVGVNRWTTGEHSPLITDDGSIMIFDPAVEQEQIGHLNQWRQERYSTAVSTTLAVLRLSASEGRNVMPTSIAAAKAGATTVEWAAQMHRVRRIP